MGGTRGSGVVCGAEDMLEVSGARGVGGVCEMCMCLAHGRVREWMRGLGLGFTNHIGTGGVGNM